LAAYKDRAMTQKVQVLQRFEPM